MLQRLTVLAAVMLCAALSTTAAFAEKRVALVVGNGAYTMPRMTLQNPPADARTISAALQRLGFEVETAIDVDKEKMEDAVARLSSRSRVADVTLFYFAGHGLQDLGRNHLMPTDAQLGSETDLRRRFVRLDDILGDLSNAKGARIVILDACRDSAAVDALRAAVPQTRSATVTRGLAAVPRTFGMLVAFATQPDRVAADGTSGNSPFTSALAARLLEPGVELRTALTRVRSDVASATGNAQVPEVSDSLLGELYLGRPEEAAAKLPVIPSAASDPAAESLFWSSVERGNSPALYRAYLERFGEGGLFAPIAKLRLAEAEKALPAKPSAAGNAASDSTSVASLTPATGPRLTAATEADIAQCDRLAAHPDDKTKPADVDGVNLSSIDGDKAVAECTRAVQHRPDDARLIFQLARALDNSTDYVKAHELYGRAAGAGHAVAMHHYAYNLREGRGTTRDFAQSYRWFSRSAEKGFAAAMVDAGLALSKGVGVKKDVAAARRWYEQAAMAGNAMGMNNIGVVYRDGLGVTADSVQARKWLERAAARGNALSMTNLGVMYRDALGVTRNYDEAREWGEMAAARRRTSSVPASCISAPPSSGTASPPAT